MKILLAASEVAPIIKIGGLGDVVGSLPKALEKLDVEVSVIAPFYPTAKVDLANSYQALDLKVPFNNETHTVEIHRTNLPDSNVDVILVKNDDFFDQGGTNFYAKSISETEMYAFFNRCVVEFIKAEFNTYDLVHCNDWHTGLITHLLQDEIPDSRPSTLFTIHNIMYQGIGDGNVVKKVGINPGEHQLIDWDISDGDLNMMLQGITSADYVNTVSETYAKEILTKEFGGVFYEILKAREGRLVGILNGIDYKSFDRKYDKSNWKPAKESAKEALQKKFNLDINAEVPLYSFIGRLDPGQKGLDILFDSIDAITDSNAQFVLLGTGAKDWEKKFNNLNNMEKYKGRISCQIMFDVKLAEEIYAASDFLVVPSRYEPCGLIQMIAMYYGTLPVVNGVGGLKDTVKEGHNGFVFDEYSSKALISAFKRSLEVYKNKENFIQMTNNAIEENFGWEKSALTYAELYRKIIDLRSN